MTKPGHTDESEDLIAHPPGINCFTLRHIRVKEIPRRFQDRCGTFAIKHALLSPADSTEYECDLVSSLHTTGHIRGYSDRYIVRGGEILHAVYIDCYVP